MKRSVVRYARRLGCVMLSLACFGFLSGNPAFAQQQAPPKTAGGTLTIDLASMQKPWTGDLDGMIDRRVIRVLTTASKTFYFIDKGVQRGIVVDYFRVFEDGAQQEARGREQTQGQEAEGTGGIHPRTA